MGTQAVTAVIIGAGMSGLLAGIRLKRAGEDDFVIVEKSNSVGGTWFDNSYPGASCDVPSHLYSYSFAPNPHWTRAFARQPEILAYFRRVAADYGLEPHLHLSTEVKDAVWDDSAARWTVTAADGRAWSARMLIIGTGQLNKPWKPGIPGADSFGGAQFHSARWDHAVDLAGKRVASIGNGASAVQYIPEVAKEAERVTIFQRSANWVIPRPDEEISPEARARNAKLPWLPKLARFLIWATGESRWGAFEKPRGWASRRLTKMALKQLNDQVPDAKLRAVLTPDYPIGCKRVLITDDYYPAVCRDNVEIVTDRIARIDASGIVTEHGRHIALDVIVWGTGFETAGFVAPIEVQGRGGRRLADDWRLGAEAHKGVTVTGYPNMFLLYGPNTNLGHNSIIYMAERQMDYAMQLIERLRVGAATLDVKPQAQAEWNRALQAKLSKSVWAEGCASWYKHDGKITNNWSGSTWAYRRETKRADVENYLLT
jgi:cation diffusion facilitator CzcD-associated flavoprotein CzcO